MLVFWFLIAAQQPPEGDRKGSPLLYHEDTAQASSYSRGDPLRSPWLGQFRRFALFLPYLSGERTPVGDSIGPLIAAAFTYADATHGTGIGPVSAATPAR